MMMKHRHKNEDMMTNNGISLRNIVDQRRYSGLEMVWFTKENMAMVKIRR